MPLRISAPGSFGFEPAFAGHARHATALAGGAPADRLSLRLSGLPGFTSQSAEALEAQRDDLAAARGILLRMKDAAGRAVDARFSERDRSAAKQELVALQDDLRALALTAADESLVPGLTSNRRSVIATDSPVRLGAAFGAATVTGLTVGPNSAGAAFQFRTIATGSPHDVVEFAGTLSIGASYDTNTLTARTVNVADATASFTLYADPTAVTALGAGTVQVGSVFDTNTVTAVDVSAAQAGVTFTMARTSASNVRMTNGTTGQSQTIDVGPLAVINGAKTLNFNELGVSISFLGLIESGPNNFAKALDGDTVVTVASNEYRSLRLVRDGGGTQTIDTRALAATNGTKVIDFNTLGVSLTLDGPAESSLGALVLALHGKTITKSTTTIPASGSALELRNIETGTSDYVSLADGETTTHDAVLNFSLLGVQLTLVGNAAFTLRDVSATLNGARLTVASEEESPLDIAFEGAQDGDLETPITDALAAVEQRAAEIEGDLLELAKAHALLQTTPDELRAAVVTQNVLSQLGAQFVDTHRHVDGAIVNYLLTR